MLNIKKFALLTATFLSTYGFVLSSYGMMDDTELETAHHSTRRITQEDIATAFNFTSPSFQVWVRNNILANTLDISANEHGIIKKSDLFELLRNISTNEIAPHVVQSEARFYNGS